MGNSLTNSNPPGGISEQSNKQLAELSKRRAEAAAALPCTEMRYSPKVGDTLTSLFPVGVIVADAAGEIVFCNPDAHEMVGGQLTGDAFGPSAGYQLCIPEGRPYTPDELPLPRSLLKGETVRGEEVLVRVDNGTNKTILVSSVPVRDEEGTITGAVAIFQDFSRQKQAELLLRETEERFRVLADSAPVLIWMSDETGRCTFFNHRWSSFTGRPLADLISEGWWAGVHPDDMACCTDVYALHFGQRRAFRIEYRLRRADGLYRWVMDNRQPRYHADGSFAGFIGSCIDITDRKQMEASLQESEARFRAIFERAAIGIGLVDINDNSVLQSNPALSHILGYTNKELADTSFTEYTHPEDIEPNLTLYSQMIAGEQESFQLAKRFLHKDGHVVWGHLISSLVRDANNNPLYVLGMVQDITEHRQAEDKLRWNESLLQAMAASSPFGYYVVDHDNGHVLYSNRRFCEIWRMEDLQQQLLARELKHEDVLSRCHMLLRHKEDCAADDRSCAYEDELELLDGRTIRRYSTLVSNPDGRHLGQFFIFEDISERKQLENALYQAKIEAERAREHAEYLACTDYLTGLLNRRSFVQRFEDEVNRAWREAAPLSVILADIDSFKAINDTYGHQAGDIGLQEFARCLDLTSRPYDFVGRYGGEEFIICLPNTTCEQATKIAERIRAAIEELKIRAPHRNESIRMTASLGVASLVRVAMDHGDLLIKLADDAMYKAKSRGNCVCVAEDPAQLRFDLPR